MSSIDTYIDAAVPGDKARAAQFDDKPGWISLDEMVARKGAERVYQNLIERAIDNLETAGMTRETRPEKAAESLHDARNLEALALSLLPDEKGGGS